MSVEKFIIYIYIFIDDFLKNNNLSKIRNGGPAPKLSDAEVITVEIAGEFLGYGSDKTIYDYFKLHWNELFPQLECRTTFGRQAANLCYLKKLIYSNIVQQIQLSNNDVFICDGLPIPTCNPKRVSRKNPFWIDGKFSYCAAKDKKYFGFKSHLVATREGLIIDFAIAAANIDERDILPEITEKLSGILIADKGLIRPSLKEELMKHNLDLQTPLRSNMKDPRPKKLVAEMMNIRRNIETVNAQLVERFHIQAIRAKDLWHLASKILRKILAHSFAFMLAGSLEFDGILSR